MSVTEWVPIIAASAALIVAGVGAVQKRRQPQLDEAQAQSALVNSDSVKATIRRMSEETNMSRDLRILDLEQWGDKMRPWTSSVFSVFEKMCQLMREDRAALGLDMPDIHLDPPPPFPPPRPLP